MDEYGDVENDFVDRSRNEDDFGFASREVGGQWEEGPEEMMHVLDGHRDLEPTDEERSTLGADLVVDVCRCGALERRFRVWMQGYGMPGVGAGDVGCLE